MSEDSESKMKSEIISMSLSKSLLEKVDQLQVEREFSSRSEVIRHCLLQYTQDVDKKLSDDTSGTFIVGISYYSKKSKPADILGVIKDFSNDIILTSRYNASSEVTVIIYLLNTKLALVKMFFEKLSAIKGLMDKKLFTIRTQI